MKWFNLKSNKCPQCGKDFMKGLETKKLNSAQMSALSNTGGKVTATNVLMIHPCGFKITDQRYKEIVSDMTTNQLNSQAHSSLL